MASVDDSGNDVGSGASGGGTPGIDFDAPMPTTNPGSGRQWVPVQNPLTGMIDHWTSDSVPKESTPSTHVTVAPADTTGAWISQFDSQGNMVLVNKITGEVKPVDFNKGTAATPEDKYNVAGFDIRTGMAWGVHADPTGSSPSGLVYNGIPVNPDGSVWQQGDPTSTAWDKRNDTGTGGTSNLHYFASGGLEYAYDPKTGQTKVIGGQPAGGGSSAARASSTGGGSGSASAAISAAASQANAALSAEIEREKLKQAADQFAQTYGLDKEKAAQAADQFDRQLAYNQQKDQAAQDAERGKTTAAFVANPNDMIAREYWLHTGIEPQGTPVNIFTGQASGPATTQGALNDVQSMQAAGGMASSAPPPPVSATTTPPPPGYAKGTDRKRAGYTTAPYFKVAEKGSEMVQNPTGAPLRVLNHAQTTGRSPVPPPGIQAQPPQRRMMPFPMPPAPGFATGTDTTATDTTGSTTSSTSNNPYGVFGNIFGNRSPQLPSGFTDWNALASKVGYNGDVSDAYGQSHLLNQYNTMLNSQRMNDFFSDPQHAIALANYNDAQDAYNNRPMVDFDLASQMGIPMTAGQRNAVGNAAMANFEKGNYYDNRLPFVTREQVQDVLPKVLPSGDTPQKPGFNTMPTPPPAKPETQPAAAASTQGPQITSGWNLVTTPSAVAYQPGYPPMFVNDGKGGYRQVQVGEVVPTGTAVWVQGAAPQPAATAVAAPPPKQPAAPAVPAGVKTIPDTSNLPPVFIGGYTSGDPMQQIQPRVPEINTTLLTPPPASVPYGGDNQTNNTTAPPPPPATTGGNATPPPAGSGTAAPPSAAGTGTGPSAIAYDPSAYANLPALQYLKGLMSPQDFANLTSASSSGSGLGGALPAPNQLNYAYLASLKQTDPTGFAVMQALWKARNRDLDQEMAYAQQRAPISDARSTDLITE